jgi:hypothetical protein
MVRKARMTVIVSGVVAALTCGSTLNAARDATREPRANRVSQSQSAPVDRSKLTVRVTPLVRLTRGDARGVVIVPRHGDNRVLRIILESEDYYSLSDIPLDGEYAALSYPLSWRDLPPGSYCVTVQVYGPTGMRTSTSIGSIHAFQKDQ